MTQEVGVLAKGYILAFQIALEEIFRNHSIKRAMEEEFFKPCNGVRKRFWLSLSDLGGGGRENKAQADLQDSVAVAYFNKTLFYSSCGAEILIRSRLTSSLMKMEYNTKEQQLQTFF